VTGRLAYRMGEVAEQLNVGLSTVQRWVASGALPHIRPPGGGVVLIQPDDLTAFLAAHREGNELHRRSTRKRSA
jgi:excisionase family DNA binding protein